MLTILSNLSIRYKILAIPVVGVVGFALYLALNFFVASSNAERLTNIRDVYFPVLEKTDANISSFARIKESLNSAVMAADMDMLEEADAYQVSTLDNFREIRRFDTSREGQVDSLTRAFELYYDRARELSAGLVNGTLDLGSAKPRIQAMETALKDYESQLRRFREEVYATFVGTVQESEETANNALMFGVVTGLGLVILLGGIGMFVASTVTNSLNHVVLSIRDLAEGEGDLRKRLRANRNDELGTLSAEFNRFVENLHGIVSEIVSSMTTLTSSAEEMMVISEQSSQSITRQQTDVDQVATAMNEMSATVQEVARNTTEAASAAKDALNEAERGRNVVNDAVHSINMLAGEVDHAANVIQQLEQHSESVGSVLDVIKAIAEQTNLLALNAAIEAARAGEQGRGFAVVADEVRTLAQRTQESTQEIQEIIEQLMGGAEAAVKVMMQSREKAQSSVERSSSAGEALSQITGVVSRINDMNTQIASAAEEQSAVAEEVNRSIVAISQVSQQSADSSQHIASTSESVSNMAQQMGSLVGKFKV